MWLILEVWWYAYSWYTLNFITQCRWEIYHLKCGTQNLSLQMWVGHLSTEMWVGKLITWDVGWEIYQLICGMGNLSTDMWDGIFITWDVEWGVYLLRYQVKVINYPSVQSDKITTNWWQISILSFSTVLLNEWYRLAFKFSTVYFKTFFCNMPSLAKFCLALLWFVQVFHDFYIYIINFQ